MSNSFDHNSYPERIRQLENRLGRQVFQLKGLMSVTQAINENVNAEGLFDMLGRFLSFEMQIGSFTLFFREDDEWKLVAQAEADMTGFDEKEVANFISSQGNGTRNLSKETEGFSRQFDYGLKVMHKSTPLAYLFMGQFRQEDDVKDQLDFVTAVTNVVAVAIENKRLFKEQMNQQILNREVELAAEIQKALVPKKLPSKAKYEMSSIYRPHFAVGGDYYDVVEFPDEQVAFCVADITGKGVPAALLMANFQANFHTLVPRRPSLEEIAQEMNSAVHRVTDGERFITLFLGKYNPENRTLHYVNAGHTPPFLVTYDKQVVRLNPGTTVLGWLPELPFIEIGGLCLTGPALIFSFTDGLTDIVNANGDSFSDEILEEFLKQNVHLSAKDLNTKLLEYVDEFRGEEPFPDDITVLSCKIL